MHHRATPQVAYVTCRQAFGKFPWKHSIASRPNTCLFVCVCFFFFFCNDVNILRLLFFLFSFSSEGIKSRMSRVVPLREFTWYPGGPSAIKRYYTRDYFLPLNFWSIAFTSWKLFIFVWGEKEKRKEKPPLFHRFTPFWKVQLGLAAHCLSEVPSVTRGFFFWERNWRWLVGFHMQQISNPYIFFYAHDVI